MGTPGHRRFSGFVSDDCVQHRPGLGDGSQGWEAAAHSSNLRCIELRLVIGTPVWSRPCQRSKQTFVDDYAAALVSVPVWLFRSGPLFSMKRSGFSISWSDDHLGLGRDEGPSKRVEGRWSLPRLPVRVQHELWVQPDEFVAYMVDTVLARTAGSS